MGLGNRHEVNEPSKQPHGLVGTLTKLVLRAVAVATEYLKSRRERLAPEPPVESRRPDLFPVMGAVVINVVDRQEDLVVDAAANTMSPVRREHFKPERGTTELRDAVCSCCARATRLSAAVLAFRGEAWGVGPAKVKVALRLDLRTPRTAPQSTALRQLVLPTARAEFVAAMPSGPLRRDAIQAVRLLGPELRLRPESGTHVAPPRAGVANRRMPLLRNAFIPTPLLQPELLALSTVGARLIVRSEVEIREQRERPARGAPSGVGRPHGPSGSHRASISYGPSAVYRREGPTWA